MTTQEEIYNENAIIEGNKDIAEFMGVLRYRPDADFIELNESDLCELIDAEYHSSWNWLMPVVKRILIIASEMDEMERYHVVIDNMPDVQAVWLAVVEFIKWYNANKE